MAIQIPFYDIRQTNFQCDQCTLPVSADVPLSSGQICAANLLPLNVGSPLTCVPAVRKHMIEEEKQSGRASTEPTPAGGSDFLVGEGLMQRLSRLADEGAPLMQEILQRMQKDVLATAAAPSSSAASKRSRLRWLNEDVMTNLEKLQTVDVEDQPDVRSLTMPPGPLPSIISHQSTEALGIALVRLEELCTTLSEERMCDGERIANGVRAALDLANGTATAERESQAIIFRLRRIARMRLWLQFDGLAAATLSSTAQSDLQKLNETLTHQQIDRMLLIVSSVLFACVRLSKIHECMVGLHRLNADIRQLIEQHLVVKFLVAPAREHTASEQMVRHAVSHAMDITLRTNDFSASVLQAAAENTLQDTLATWGKVRQTFFSRHGDGPALTDDDLAMAFQHNEFKMMSISSAELVMMVELSKRGCWLTQRSLAYPRKLQAVNSSVQVQSQRKVRLVRQAATDLVVKLTAQQGYVTMDEEVAAASYDPRFLMFEVLALVH